ncbi:hypothetical protein [Peribacillus acanthi]|uniref:hypothetical protein n=1 Tax=Peribacillus acanthi TaxID=2171554 RepID=UPI000D3EC36A|nr:hypothetical protein [Peribacillus acanthi]
MKNYKTEQYTYFYECEKMVSDHLKTNYLYFDFTHEEYSITEQKQNIEKGIIKSIDSILNYPNLVLEKINLNSNCIHIILNPFYNIDTIFSIFITKYIIEYQCLPFDFERIYKNLKNLLIIDKEMNLDAIIIAAKHQNKPGDVINKFLLFFEKNLFILNDKDSTDVKNCMLLKENDLSLFSQELALLKLDKENYLSESNNHLYTKTENLDVILDENKVEEIKVKIYLQPPTSLFSEYWAKTENNGLYILFSDGIKIKPLITGFNHKRLVKNLSFFENYYRKPYEENEDWKIIDGEICNNDSILKQNQILEIMREYTDPWISTQKVSYVFPFHFDYKKFNRIQKRFSKRFGSPINEENKYKQFSKNFLPLFNDYFFNNTKLPNSQLHSRNFLVAAKKVITFNEDSFSIDKDILIDNPLLFREIKVESRLFKYGVGFLVLNSSFSGDVPLNYILEIDKRICQDVNKIISYFLKEEMEIQHESTRKGIAYESIEIIGNTYIPEKKENIVLKTCSATKKTYISSLEEKNREIQQKFLQRGDLLFYGFSRSCGVQYLVEKDSIDRTGLEKLSKNFLEEKFFIFLFSAQQRDGLRKFSDKIVRDSLVSEKMNASAIRQDFLHFLTQAKLGHISDNNVIAKFYEKWQVVFDSEAIYKEVNEKLNAIDQYQQTKLSFRFNLVSYVLFPIVFLSSLFTMSIFKTKSSFELDVYIVLLMCAFSVGLFFIRTKSK